MPGKACASPGYSAALIRGGEETVNIFLECACFDPVSIRKTARRHGLNYRCLLPFRAGTDPSITVYVLKRAAMLIKEIAGGTISSDVTDQYPEPVKPVRLELDYGYVMRLVGEHIPGEKIERILTLLDFKSLRKVSGDWWWISPCTGWM
jgi:phenylalanyl-tRNA synthetase beta chain